MDPAELEPPDEDRPADPGLPTGPPPLPADIASRGSRFPAVPDISPALVSGGGIGPGAPAARPEPVAPDPAAASTPANQEGGHSLDDPSSPSRRMAFYPSAPLQTIREETKAAAAAIRHGSIHDYDIDDYRLAAETPSAPDGATGADPPDADESDAASWDFSPQSHIRPEYDSADRIRSHAAAPKSWWETSADRFRTDRRVQLIGLASVLIVLVGILMLSHPSNGVAISDIRRHAREWDGQVVTVKGTIGEVFPMGSSYAYHLRQGGDTIVVFTRTGAPATGRRVEVKGSVSTGMLEGVPRAALFEQSAP